jgi:hypothetical protein
MDLEYHKCETLAAVGSAAKSIQRNCSGSRRKVSENFPEAGGD